MSDMSQAPRKRPIFLRILAILSFVYVSLGLVANLGALFQGPFSPEEIDEIQADSYESIDQLREMGYSDLSDVMESSLRIEQYVNDNIYEHSLLSVLVLLFGFYGVYLMFRGRRRGFHIYIIYSIMSAVLVYVSVPIGDVPLAFTLISLGISALFVWMYSRNMHYMK
ncbi:MAG: hypothetical protein EP338_13575 [Bacteroidetes bacterium]|nr:MAG: hypothetical protein EP338_13575 [Bacteroidota bacterium]